MELQEFLSTSLDERADFIWRHGISLLSRNVGYFEITLYYTDKFFAEIWVNNVQECIVMIRGFENNQLLEPYLYEIELPELFNI